MLPVCVLTLSWGRMEYLLQIKEKYVVPIVGYDPRDLLSGHYIQYRIEWNYDQEKLEEFKKEFMDNSSKLNSYMVPAYLCMIKKESELFFYPMLLKKSQGCLEVIKGEFTNFKSFPSSGFGFNVTRMRYYVPEKYGRLLEEALTKNNAQVSFVVSDNNEILVSDLRLNGRPWKDVIAEKK